MQTSGTFPALNGGMSRLVSSKLRGPSVNASVAGAQAPNPIAPPRRRRQIVTPQPKAATSPLGALAQGNLGAMVAKALSRSTNG